MVGAMMTVAVMIEAVMVGAMMTVAVMIEAVMVGAMMTVAVMIEDVIVKASRDFYMSARNRLSVCCRNAINEQDR